MATLAEVNMTLQDQGETLRETHQTLLGMLQEDINARKAEERAAGDRREKEREAKNRRQGPPSVKGMGSGEAFTRGLLGDRMFGSLDNLMSMAFGAAGGLIPFAFKNIGRGLKFGGAALALTSLTEKAVDFVFDNLEDVGIDGLTQEQRDEVVKKANAAVNTGFGMRMLGFGGRASLAGALGAAFGTEIGEYLGGVVDEDGNMKIKIPFAKYMGYPEGEIELGPTGQAALGAISLVIGSKLLGVGVRYAAAKFAAAKPGFWSRIFAGIAGVSLADMAEEAIKNDATRTAPKTTTPTPGRQLDPAQRFPNQAPTGGAVTKGQPTVGRDPKTGRFTSLKNTVPNAFVEPGRGPISYPQQAANSNVAPKKQTLADAIRNADKALTSKPWWGKLVKFCQVGAKVLPYVAWGTFIYQAADIMASNAPVKQKRAAMAQLIGMFVQGSAMTILGSAIGAAAATSLGVTAGWGTVLGGLVGGGIGFFSPNFIGDKLAGWLVGDKPSEAEISGRFTNETNLMLMGAGKAGQGLGFAGSTIDESESFFNSVANDPNYAPTAFALNQERLRASAMMSSNMRGFGRRSGRNLGADLGIGFNPNRTADDVSLLNEMMRLKQPTIVINNDNSTTDNSSAYKAEGNRYLSGTGMTATDLKYDKMYMGIKGFGGSVGQVF